MFLVVYFDFYCFHVQKDCNECANSQNTSPVSHFVTPSFPIWQDWRADNRSAKTLIHKFKQSRKFAKFLILRDLFILSTRIRELLINIKK